MEQCITTKNVMKTMEGTWGNRGFDLKRAGKKNPDTLQYTTYSKHVDKNRKEYIKMIKVSPAVG